ncbi:hypothetical protein X777_01379 [Ooceraea biroi]|uniref:Uncharacterized protein n=1 Tax=Ooceraea biroi TaxID=2015173 RepID=A0A026WQV0_OOCBI|nr:hypothetical protein X777_01379 [Ooceraea biroi]
MPAIKKLSTRNRKTKKSRNSSSSHTIIPDLETTSLSWSLPSLDAKSIDTYMTYVPESQEDYTSSCSYCCDEYEENQRNENRENEMII